MNAIVRVSLPALMTALERSALTLWVGGMWAIGYLAAPVLFLSLPDPMTAGAIAGTLFRVTGYIGIVCGLVLLAGALYHGRGAGSGRWRSRVIGAMLTITLIGEFGLMPVMERLKLAAGGRLVAGSEIARQFGLMHGVSSTLFLVNSILGLLLVIRGLRPAAAGG